MDDITIETAGNESTASADFCVPVLASVSRQLSESMQQMKTGVSDACLRFQRIDAHSWRNAEDGLESLGQSEAQTATGPGVEQLCQLAASTIGRQLAMIEKSCAQSVELAERIQQVQRSVGTIDGFLKRIDALAERTKVLALNGRIEAARVGAQGKAFAVVAAETSSMALFAAETSRSIRVELEGVSRTVTETAAALTARAGQARAEALQSKAEGHASLAELGRINQALCQSVTESVERNRQLARDIACAVMALQFEDAVTQRLSHCVAALDALRESVADTDGAAPAGTAALDDWRDRLASACTMASERHALAAVFNGEGGAELAPAESDGGNITLF